METRHRGLSARWKLTLSYAGFLMLASVLLLAVVWVFLLRYVPDTPLSAQGGFVPNRSDLLRAFVPRTKIALLVLLIFGLVGGWLLAGYMLSPLTRLTRATRIASTGALDHRIRMHDRRDEFGELADAFDHMLDRIESQVAEQQRFAANASHELRTPLAIMRTIIDVAEKEPDRETAAVLARLKETNTRAIDLTEALLLLSRAGNAIDEFDDVDLSLFVDEVIETLLPLAEQHHIVIEIDTSAAYARGSAPLLLQMIMNLVHNAIVHNRPEQGRIWVHTSQSSGRAIVAVENTGTEVSPDEIRRFGEPFLKGAGRERLDNYTGSGLGLSIVEKIVRTHHGTMHLAPRGGGGILVRVEL